MYLSPRSNVQSHPSYGSCDRIECRGKSQGAWKWKWKLLSHVHLLATVHGILQARILEWVAFPFSRGSSQPRDRTQVSHILYQLSHKVIPLWAPASGRIITGFSSKLRLANSNKKSVSSPHCKGCLENQESQLHLNPNKGNHSKFQPPASSQSMP